MAEPSLAGPGHPRLVVLRALGLGDLLTGVPALRALATAFPGHALQLAAPSALAPLVRLIDPRWKLVHTAALAPLEPVLARPDVAVNLHGRGPQSHRVLTAARPARLIAFRHPGVRESARGPRWLADEHEVARWCRMLGESGVPADPTRLELDPGHPTALPSTARGATIVHPGAASRARQWPPERFAAAARSEREAGRAVLVTGSSRERALAEEVARRSGLRDEFVLAGRTDLAELAALVAAAGRVLCGDTGVAHLATALGTPSVVLFGPTSPAHWGPPRERAEHVALWSGRRGDSHGERPHPGLLEIDLDDVLSALRALPERKLRAGAARARSHPAAPAAR